jgi:hypothetical protein
VRGQDHGHPGLLELPDDAEDLGDEFGVEGRGDLVQQHHLGPARQRADDRHPLLLAARQPVGVLPGLVGQAEPRQQAMGLLDGLVPCGLVHLDRRQGDVVEDRHVREQVVRLEDHADLLADLVLVGADRGDLIAVQEDRAVVDGLQEVGAAQQGRLARPRGTDQADDLMGGDVEIDSAQHRLAVVALPQTFDPDERLHHRPPGARRLADRTAR